MKILVSACLLGLRCRYDGQSKPNAAVLALGEKHTLVPCCPEQLGGLPTPRSPSEWQGARIVNAETWRSPGTSSARWTPSRQRRPH